MLYQNMSNKSEHDSIEVEQTVKLYLRVRNKRLIQTIFANKAQEKQICGAQSDHLCKAECL